MAETLKPSPLQHRKPPLHPIQDWLWNTRALYDGLLVRDDERASAVITRFAPHLKSVRRIDDMLCVVFATPVMLDPLDLGTALPLRQIPGGGVASFDIAALPSQPKAPHALHIVKGGTLQTYDLRGSVVVDPLSFWDLGNLEVSRSNPLQTKPASEESAPPVPVATQAARIVKRTTEGPLFKDVKSAIDAAPDTPLKDWATDLGHGIGRVFIGLCFFGFVLLLATGLVSSGFGPILIKLLVGFVVVVILLLLFGGQENVVQVQPQPQRPSGIQPTKPRGPGFLSRMLNWAKWQTPFGNRLRRDLEKHINDTAKMIADGDIDKALKHALALGAAQEAEDKKRGLGISKVPEPRGTLDLDFSGHTAGSSAVLSGLGYSSIAAQYQYLAQKLSKDGDHRRAAFIYAELLSNVPSALQELEKIKAFEEAAKLATARKQPGHIAARLWFLAGEKDIALSIARRSDALGYIANVAQDRDPEFAAFVRGHWMQSMIAAGDLGAAVRESRGHPNLARLHEIVVQQAILAGLLDDPDVLNAAVATLPWPLEALSQTFVSSQQDPTSIVATQINRAVYGQDPEAMAQRQILIQGFGADAPERKKSKTTYWTERAPLLGDTLIRTILGYDAKAVGAPPLDTLTRTAKALGLHALHEDLRHIRRKSPKKKQVERFAIPEPGTNPRVWSGAVCAAVGQTLLWHEAGEVGLFDSQGERVWTGQLPEMAGAVPIGAGRLMILIQGPAARRRISVFDTRTHSLRFLGVTQLITWHTSAKATSWAVQTPTAIGALDVAAMLDDTPDFHLLWSVTQTVSVIVIAFKESDVETRWITQRIEISHYGLLEKWRYDRSNQNLLVTIANPDNDPTRALHEDPHIWSNADTFVAADQQANAVGIANSYRFESYDYAREEKITREQDTFFLNLGGIAYITSLQGKQIGVFNTKNCPLNAVTFTSNGSHRFAAIGSAAVRTQHASQDGDHLVFIDAERRVVRCDFRRCNVRVIGSA